jgi:Kdo2-lipid IVA lauroyltransferase/acyltransferase
MLSDALYLLVWYVIGYRKEVVAANLRNSFPDKSEAEIRVLSKKYYRYFCDLTLETFKTLTISKKSMLRHCSMEEQSRVLLEQLAQEGQSVILVLGHMGNWEWAGNAFSLQCRHQLYVIYHPLANKYFDRLMHRMRSRFGTRLIPMPETFKEMVHHKSELTATAFIADQTPQPHHAYWTRFLNQDTPVFQGTELIAKKLKRPVLFFSVERQRRGYYKVIADPQGLMCPEKYDRGNLTETHIRKLETKILEQPETWLWSHRRWKHKRQTTI